jgi:hypothetical protein
MESRRLHSGSQPRKLTRPWPPARAKSPATISSADGHRVYSLGVDHIVTITPGDQADLVAASRALRRLLQSYERVAGRPLGTVLLAGGV